MAQNKQPLCSRACTCVWDRETGNEMKSQTHWKLPFLKLAGWTFQVQRKTWTFKLKIQLKQFKKATLNFTFSTISRFIFVLFGLLIKSSYPSLWPCWWGKNSRSLSCLQYFLPPGGCFSGQQEQIGKFGENSWQGTHNPFDESLE